MRQTKLQDQFYVVNYQIFAQGLRYHTLGLGLWIFPRIP
jgi:hypothetical protein